VRSSYYLPDYHLPARILIQKRLQVRGDFNCQYDGPNCETTNYSVGVQSTQDIVGNPYADKALLDQAISRTLWPFQIVALPVTSLTMGGM
jgi:hypothetical protein